MAQEIFGVDSSKLAAGIGLGGGVLGGIGRAFQGGELARAYRANANLLERDNQILAIALAQGTLDITKNYRATQGTLRAAAGKSGIEIGTGSAGLADIELSREATLERMRLKFNIENQMAVNRFRAREARRSARHSIISGAFGALGSVAGGIGFGLGAFGRG